MGAGSPVPFRDVERALRRGGAVLSSSTGSHFTYRYRNRPYTIPVKHNHVKAGYVKSLRKFWFLTNDDGVSDDDFWEGRWA